MEREGADNLGDLRKRATNAPAAIEALLGELANISGMAGPGHTPTSQHQTQAAISIYAAGGNQYALPLGRRKAGRTSAGVATMHQAPGHAVLLELACRGEQALSPAPKELTPL